MKRKRETSKVVLACVLCFCAVGAVCVLIGWIAFDRADAAALMAAVLSPALTAVGFYAWKAKAENVLKIAKGIDKDAEREALNTVAQEKMQGNNNDFYGY